MDNNIWERIRKVLGEHDKKIEVVKVFLKYGLSVRGGGVYVGEKIKIPFKSIADEAGVDRRTVVETVKSIRGDSFLRRFFELIKPAGASLVDVARLLGYRCLIVETFSDQPGILAWVADSLAERQINILQVIAEDPGIYENPKLYVVVSGSVPGEVIDRILEHPAIRRVSIG